MLAALGLALAVIQSGEARLRFDELLTYHLATLDGYSELQRALEAAADTQPPLSYVWVSLAMRHAGPAFEALGFQGGEAMALRLPSSMAFAAATFLLVRWLAAWSGALAGCVGALSFWTAWGFRYGAEARPYAFILLGLVLAAESWRRIRPGAPGWVAAGALAASLAFAVSSHYQAVTIFFPLVVAEAVRTYRAGRLDVRPWLAMALGGCALIPALPLMRVISQTYTAGFWSRAVPSDYVGSYLFALAPLAPIVAALGLLRLLTRGRSGASDPGSPPLPRAEEMALILATVALPLATVTMALLVTKGYVYRYSLPVVIGLAALLALWTGRALPRAGHRALAVGLCGLCFVGVHAAFDRLGPSAAPGASEWTGAGLAGMGAGPIVATDPMTVLEGLHNAPAELSSRLLYVADVEAAMAHAGSDSPERNLLQLQPFVGFRLEAYRDFQVRREPFYLWRRPEQRFDWIVSRLEREGRRVTPVARFGDRELLRCCREEATP